MSSTITVLLPAKYDIPQSLIPKKIVNKLFDERHGTLVLLV